MEKLQSVDWRGLYKTATNKVKKYTMNLSELELQVEDATSLEVWGPHGSVMTEIAESSFDPESYRQIMGVIARRLKEEGENWRMCYKALLLLEFLIKHGPTQVVRDVESSGGVLDRLTRFQFKDPNGKDHGQNVRHRAGEIVALEERALPQAILAAAAGEQEGQQRHHAVGQRQRCLGKEPLVMAGTNGERQCTLRVCRPA
ncbi:hypothetical protein APUTEX25_001916 [Auxenochlorella protothecoides]|uniref:ENTH domain-containing protein n=1 Tax=Auxenochlorella protothecoides TaxID=3075 RepID=A0A3M7L8A5_AUXPR|nr:hypothetical protein APUTEX25_001916 [Auxenochlorella protothecoides]|eukprot:RMZ57716.1 hypothetical protein APUTEX25_001916 [Auxenochlorella protothecoides]